MIEKRMSQPFDIRQFPGLPPEVVKAFEAQQFELAVERAARQHEQAVGAEKDVFITELKALVEKLESQVADHRRTKFGPKSEKLSPDQLELALEDQETAIAETQQQIDEVQNKLDQLDKTAKDKKPRKPRKPRTLPEGLPRVERVINPENIVCPCGCGDMVKIGEDRSERLDVIPAQYQVVVTVRPKYACPKGRTGVVQAKAPAHLLENSWPTEALLAQITVAKFCDFNPLNRQSVAMARNGAPIDRAVLSDWMGRTGALIAPVVDHMAMLLLKGSTRLYVDETTAPVLDPGRGKTKTGYFWAVLRDDRGWNGPSRKSELGKALAYMLRRQEGFRLFLDDGHVDMDSNLVENAIRSPAMTRRNTLFAGHDDGARCWARFASLIGTCRINGVEPYAYLLDLYTKLAKGHLKKDIDALMPWAYAAATSSQMSSPGTP